MKADATSFRVQLEAREKKILAPYAVHSSTSQGRAYPEHPSETRTCFQRDRDRILHSKAFRRLSGKTQVFVDRYLDHVRDRLSHSLEVAQVGRDLARALRLNEDLTEAICLAHDLGHTPFGHAGEHALDKIMRQFGSHYEHNEQSKRIVEKLETHFPRFAGLNLSFEVRDGLAKHQTRYDQAGKEISGKTLEAQIADLADEIAYHNHDIDDGIRARLFTIRDLKKLKLWKRASERVQKNHGKNLSDEIAVSRGISALFSMMTKNILKTAQRRLASHKIQTLDDVAKHPRNIIGFSATFEKEVAEVRDFLWKRMYQSPQVLRYSRRGQKILTTVFWHFYKQPKLLPPKFREKIDMEDPLEVVVKDYIAGMTDSFITNIYQTACSVLNVPTTIRK